MLLAVDLSFFCCGLAMTAEGGLFLFNIFDLRLVASLLLSTIAEFVLVGWVFGIKNFLNALGEMGMDFQHGSKFMKFVGYFWMGMICFVTPTILVTLVVLTWVEFDGMSLDGKTYPGWAEGLGWFIELVPVSVACLGRRSNFEFTAVQSCIYLRRAQHHESPNRPSHGFFWIFIISKF